MKKIFRIEYSATFEVEADTEEEAIEKTADIDLNGCCEIVSVEQSVR